MKTYTTRDGKAVTLDWQGQIRLWLLRHTPRPGRPKPPTPAFKTCAGCGTASGGAGNSQKVPDPAQFVAGYAPAGRHAAPEPTEVTSVLTIDAAPVWCTTCRRWFHAIRCYSLHRHD